MNNKGCQYEEQAACFLKNKGHRILQRNYSIKRGEIDLITLEEKTSTIVFVEVRYRKNALFGSAEETITKTKIAKILTTAQHYLSCYNLWDKQTRFDVIAISGSTSTTTHLNWIKNAFSA